MQTLEHEIKKNIDSIRPPAEIRDKLDIGYTFRSNSLMIFEIRPKWDNHFVKTNSPIAKARYIKSKDLWKIYWMRGNGNWEPYEPQPECSTLNSFFRILQKDQHGCFWG
jgi:hypothetical protein